MVWPVLALIGFVVLMALVIALGTRSTRLFEAERDASPVAAGTSGGAEPARGGTVDAIQNRGNRPPSAVAQRRAGTAH